MTCVSATDLRRPLTFSLNVSFFKKKGKVFSKRLLSTFHVFKRFLKAKSLKLFFLGLICQILSLTNEIYL